jgi:hypothetical protein
MFMIPSATFADFYGKTIIGPLTETMKTSVYLYSESANKTSKAALAEQCSPREPGTGIIEINGNYEAQTPDIETGVLFMNNTQALCYPRQSMLISVSTVLVPGLSSPSSQLNTAFKLRFRSCQVGEYLETIVCTTCTDGTFSLRQDPEKMLVEFLPRHVQLRRACRQHRSHHQHLHHRHNKISQMVVMHLFSCCLIFMF